jgi:ATP-dependent RNA helicase RhlE
VQIACKAGTATLDSLSFFCFFVMENSANGMKFEEMGFPEQIRANLSRAGYAIASPIQMQAIPPGLEGRDVIGIAQTGTGKTAAFALPMLTRLQGSVGTTGLILAPTRELALQIAETFSTLGARVPVRVVTIIGGANMRTQTLALRSRPNVIVATPGRLLDHLQQKTVDLRSVQMFVMDEADRMLDMGFLPQIQKIIAALPERRQTMLFSATMPPEIARLIQHELKDPVRISIAPAGTTAERVSQMVYFVSELQKPNALLWLLEQEQGTVLVFTRTKHRADKVARMMQRSGHAVERIHGNRSLSQRLQALAGFKTGKHRVLVATDIAARGIDVANIGHVINYDLPNVPEEYVHRIGRTARAAASGNAISFIAPEDRSSLRAIERLIKQAIPQGTLPRALPSVTGPTAAPLRDAFSDRRGRPMPSRGGAGSGVAQRRDGRQQSTRTDDRGQRRGSFGAPGARQQRGTARPQVEREAPSTWQYQETPAVRWGEAQTFAPKAPIYDSRRDEQLTQQSDIIPGTGTFWESRPAIHSKPPGRGGKQRTGARGGHRQGGQSRAGTARPGYQPRSQNRGPQHGSVSRGREQRRGGR